jgi:ferredoxin
VLQTVSAANYITTIYLAVHGEDPETAGNAAVRVYGDFLGRLKRAGPAATNVKLLIEEPQPRKNDEGVYEVWANLRATVPGDLYLFGADNALDAWRGIVRREFNFACHHNHEYVFHTASRVEVTRPFFPFEEIEEEKVEAVPAGPREMIQVKVLLGGTEYNVEIPKGENLLDSVNDKGVDVKWDCKSGVCDTCQVHVLSGMENLSAPTDAEFDMLGDKVKQGYRLSCQVTANGPCAVKQ